MWGIYASPDSAKYADQFREAMKELENQKVCGLVLDLRSNSGGDMEAAASVMDMLLPAGTVVASRDSAGEETVEFTSAAGETALPVSVVMDENTYGAAELVAANVRDYKKGLLVGQQTAGHGRKSQVVPLSDGSAVFFPHRGIPHSQWAGVRRGRYCPRHHESAF